MAAILWLAKGTRIPKWIRVQNLNISVSPVKNGKARQLKILRGRAGFLPGGSVGVVMPGSDQMYIAFGPKKVFLIAQTDGLQAYNWYYCQKCVDNTGEYIDSEEGTVMGRRNLKMKCRVCNHEWTMENT